MMEKARGKSEARNKMGLSRRTHSHFDMAQGFIIGPDDMAVPLSGNMLLKPEKKGLPGSETLMETPDDSP
jgi:hypothetical protein